MKKAKKTLWDNIIIINCVLLAAMLLINVFVILLPKLKTNNYPLLIYNYEVECCSYVVTGENKHIVAKDNFYFNESNVENSSAQSALNATLDNASYVLIEYKVVNKSGEAPLQATVFANDLIVENCNLEYSFSDEYNGLDPEGLDLRIEPNSEKICRIKISIDNYSQDALCEGKFKVVLSIAKGE